MSLVPISLPLSAAEEIQFTKYPPTPCEVCKQPASVGKYKVDDRLKYFIHCRMGCSTTVVFTTYLEAMGAWNE